jgi:hypothetical protein
MAFLVLSLVLSVKDSNEVEAATGTAETTPWE